MNHPSYRSFVLTCALSLLAPACATEVTDLESEEIRQVEQEIINGTSETINNNAVAIYHFGSGSCDPWPLDIYQTPYSYTNEWWPRPCSGVVIRKDGSDQYILTARHCVTQDGTISGNLITQASHFRVTSRLAPGVIATQEWNGGINVGDTPPAGLTATVVKAPPNGEAGLTEDAHGKDLAILKVTGALQSTHPATRHAIFASTEGTTSLNGYYVASRGYGRATAGSCYGHNSSGAGVLRRGTSFGVQNSYADYFVHRNPNLSGVELVGGDSGGMVYLSDTSHASGNWRIVGVNSTGSDTAGGANLFAWIQQQSSGWPGYIYLANRGYYSTSYVVGAEPVSGASARFNYSEDSAKTRLSFDSSRRLVFDSGFCLETPNTVGGNVIVRPCSTNSRQKWQITGASGYLRSDANSNLCLSMPTTGQVLTMATCSQSLIASQAWNFFADNNPT